MNGKFIIIMFVCINLSTLVGSSVCLEQMDSCSFGDNFVLKLFIQEDDITAFQANPGATTGAGFNDDFTDTVSDLTKEQASGTFIDSTGLSFLDGIKMVLGTLTLLTPIPFISFIISAQLPLILVIILGIIPILLYVVAIMEFIRGASF